MLSGLAGAVIEIEVWLHAYLQVAKRGSCNSLSATLTPIE